MNHIIPLSLEPLRDGLASSQRNQAREHDTAAWLSIHCVAAYTQALHLALEDRPVVASTGNRLRSGRQDGAESKTKVAKESRRWGI